MPQNKLTPNQVAVMDIVIKCSQESQKGNVFRLQQIYLDAQLIEMTRTRIINIIDCLLSKGYIQLIGPDTYTLKNHIYKLL